MQTLLEQALSQRLMEEFNLNIQLRMQLIEAQARIKDLEDVKSGASPDKRTGNSGGKGSLGQERRAEN